MRPSAGTPASGSAPASAAVPPGRACRRILGGTQTGSYQTGSYQKGRFIPPKPKLSYFLFLIRPRLYASEIPPLLNPHLMTYLLLLLLLISTVSIIISIHDMLLAPLSSNASAAAPPGRACHKKCYIIV